MATLGRSQERQEIDFSDIDIIVSSFSFQRLAITSHALSLYPPEIIEDYLKHILYIVETGPRVVCLFQLPTLEHNLDIHPGCAYVIWQSCLHKDQTMQRCAQ